MGLPTQMIYLRNNPISPCSTHITAGRYRHSSTVRYEEDRDEEERQREEAERTLAGPVQVDVVRAARLQRLAGGGEIS